MKKEKSRSRLNNNAVQKFLDHNVSIVDLNTGPNEFGERWSSIINRNDSYPSDKVLDYVLGYYYDKTKMRGL